MRSAKVTMSVAPAWTAFLEEVIPSQSRHYLWLRSLSYLEYIGYRKMVKSLGYGGVNRGVYHHLTDEIQHSFMLRELAEKKFTGLGHESNFTDDFRQIAERYFQEIDDRVEDWVGRSLSEKNPYFCYLLTSYVIERRAMKVYPQYYHHLGEMPSKYIIQKIIKDESEHLSYIEGKLKDYPVLQGADLGALFDFEEACFSEFLLRLRGHFDQNGL